MRVLGIDPGLQKTGWGIIESEGHALKFLSCGLIKTDAKDEISKRLFVLAEGISGIIETFKPNCVTIEETFVNKNPASSLKLGMARGALIVVPAKFGIDVHEYPTNLVKKSVVGSGHASKVQIQTMIDMLLPGKPSAGEDEADALAVAICHAHHAQSYVRTAS